MKKRFILLSIVLLLFTVIGCSSKDSVTSNEIYDMKSSPVDNGVMMGGTEEATQATGSIIFENRKIIVNGSLNLETLEFDKTIESLNKAVEEFEAYFQSSSVNTNNDNRRYYYATVRVPADKYDEFVAKTKDSAKVTYYSESIDDVTDDYTDIEARKSSLKAEEDRLLELYDKANTIDDIVSIEQRLSEVRYEIDSLEARLKNYDLLIDYSTLSISIEEANVYIKADDNFLARLANAFINSFTNFINIVGALIILVVSNMWLLLLIGLVIFLIVRYSKNKKKKNKK